MENFDCAIRRNLKKISENVDNLRRWVYNFIVLAIANNCVIDRPIGNGGREMKTLKDVKIGGSAKVVKLHGEGALKRRIMDMGLTKGVEVYVRKVAPLGDPIELTLRGYELSLRRADAEMVEVE